MSTPTPPSSAFFFVGRLAPPELANFNVQNLEIAGNGVVEILGPHISVWWRNEPRDDFEGLPRRTADWLQTLASAYFLAADVAVNVQLESWVEVLDLEAKEAVVGFINERFNYVRAPGRQTARTHPLRRAVTVTEALITLGSDPAASLLKRAAREIWRANLDGTDEALLSANRAIECLRRTYDPVWDNRKKARTQLTRDLKPNTGRIGVLAKAAESVRHGDRPETTAAKHPINTARAQRAALLGESRRLVREAFLKRPLI